MTIEWRPALETGIEEIDRQHRELFARVNQMFASCREGRGREESFAMMSFLKGYVAAHFQTEEAKMRASGYPGYETHKAQHDAFRVEISELIAMHDPGSPSLFLVLTLNKKTTDWLINHVSRADKLFGEFLKDKPLPAAVEPQGLPQWG